jgi:hypothetical protein
LYSSAPRAFTPQRRKKTLVFFVRSGWEAQRRGCGQITRTSSTALTKEFAMFSIVKSLFNRNTRAAKRSVGRVSSRKQQRQACLSVEALEDRVLLSTATALYLKNVGPGGGVSSGPSSGTAATYQFSNLPSTVTAGSSVQVTVTEMDPATGQVISTGGASSASLSLDLNNSESASPAGSVTLTNGVGNATVTLNTPGTATLEATSGTAPNAIFPDGVNYVSGYASPITVIGPATHFVVNTASTETAGSSFTLTLTAEDAANNVVTSYKQTPNFTASDGYNVSLQSIPWKDGVGTATVTLNNPGSTTITATAGAVTGTSANITVSALTDFSNNWAGYAIQSGSGVTAVGGAWVQPTVTGPSGAQCAIWVGIDGYQNGTVEQIGTWATMVNGQAQYIAWFEFAGDGTVANHGPDFWRQTIPGFAIHPGDTITAEVSLAPGGTRTFNFTIIDQPASGGAPYGQGFHQTMQDVTPQRSSAEWIVENPNNTPNGPSQPLASFSPVNFTGCWATIDSFTGPINAFADCYAVTMAASQGNATPSAAPVQVANPSANSTSSFTVNYGTTAPSSSGSSGGSNQASGGSAGSANAVRDAVFAQDVLDNNDISRWVL